MAGARNRPLSPHLTIWKWGPHMAVSILHRASGMILATLGALTLLWFVAAIAGGEESYATFSKWVIDAGAGAGGAEDAGTTLATLATLSNILFRIIGVVVSWAFFEHLFSGLRHLLLDTGAGYELKTNKFWAMVVMIAGVAATLILWLAIFLGTTAGA